MAEVFERIAELDINIDMISMPPNHGANAGLSFTISDQDLIEVLSFANTLKTETGIKVIVSRVFSAIAASDADIRLITTSEVEISLLVTEADYDTVLEAIEEAVNAK